MRAITSALFRSKAPDVICFERVLQSTYCIHRSVTFIVCLCCWLPCLKSCLCALSNAKTPTSQLCSLLYVNEHDEAHIAPKWASRWRSLRNLVFQGQEQDFYRATVEIYKEEDLQKRVKATLFTPCWLLCCSCCAITEPVLLCYGFYGRFCRAWLILVSSNFLF